MSQQAQLIYKWGLNAKSADPSVIRPQVSPNTYCTNEQIRLRFVIL